MASAKSTAEKLSNLSIGGDSSNGSWAASAPNLQKNLGILSSDQIEFAKLLLAEGQSHLFANWPEPGVDDEEKRGFFDQSNRFLQVARLNSSYPGGLGAYIRNARTLLADAKAGKNPYDGFTPSLNVLIQHGDVPSGEMLSFGDDNFVKFEEAGIREARNAAFVLVAGGLGERLGYKGIKIPLAIMTSDDTHAHTLELLESNSYFGMKPTQVKLLKQEKVACLDDNDARLAIDPQNKYKIQTKPHGHGDVHALLYSSGLLNSWVAFTTFGMDKYFITNAPTAARDYYYVPDIWQKICNHAFLSEWRTMVINVEYNQLDPLLRATGHPDGDVNCVTGYSPYPGNINQVMDIWLAYAPVKNHPDEAAKVPKGNPYHSATSGEMAIYRANSLILRKAGMQIGNPVLQEFNGQEVEVWPRIAWKPKWALTFSDVKKKVSSGCSISQKSTMVIKGPNVFLEDLSLDGALVINAVEEAEVKVSGSVQNKGWTIEPVDYKDNSLPEEIRTRGFKIEKLEQAEGNYTEPGKFHFKV
ncbi:hypothetical protein ACLOJK_025816 [Asimina triloba]